MKSRIKLSFKDQVDRFLKVLDLVGIGPNPRIVEWNLPPKKKKKKTLCKLSNENLILL